MNKIYLILVRELRKQIKKIKDKSVFVSEHIGQARAFILINCWYIRSALTTYSDI